MNIIAKLRRLGLRQLTGLACSALLLLAAVAVLALGSSSALALALVSVVLLYILVCLALLQRRVARELREIRREQRRLRRAQQQHNRQLTLEDFPNELERIESLQKKILAAVETGRLESAERFDAWNDRA